MSRVEGETHMNEVIVLFAVVAAILIAIGVIGVLRRRALNDEAACSGAQDESVLLI